jgi:hypothetical protein
MRKLSDQALEFRGDSFDRRRRAAAALQPENDRAHYLRSGQRGAAEPSRGDVARHPGGGKDRPSVPGEYEFLLHVHRVDLDGDAWMHGQRRTCLVD